MSNAGSTVDNSLCMSNQDNLNYVDVASMRSNVIFGNPKWLPAAILKKISKKRKVAY